MVLMMMVMAQTVMTLIVNQIQVVPHQTDCTNGLDDDLDGWVDCDDYDCGIDAACVGTVEICTNGVDDDGMMVP